MKTKTIVIILSCLLVLALALGITGAVKLGGEDTTAENNRLIGILVTTEYLDLFDNDRYLEENLPELMSGETPDTGEYAGRLWGELIDRIEYGDDGTPIYSKEYVFPDNDGIFCYAAEVEESYTVTGGEGVSEPRLNINSTDDGEDLSYQCVVSVNANIPAEMELYFNPVYQTKDGRVFAVSGDAFMYSGGPEGEVYTITLSEEYTVTENGKKTTDRFSIAVATDYVYPAKTVSVIQMDGASAILSREEYTLDSLPEAISPVSGAEYIIVESRGTDALGQPVTNRAMYQPEDIIAKVFAAREDGICTPVSMDINWE